MSLLKDIKGYLDSQKEIIELQKKELERDKSGPEASIKSATGKLDAISNGLEGLAKLIEKVDTYKRSEDEAKRFMCRIETTRMSYVDDDAMPYDMVWTCHGGMCDKCKMRLVLQEMLAESKFIKDGIKSKEIDLGDYSIIKR